MIPCFDWPRKTSFPLKVLPGPNLLPDQSASGRIFPVFFPVSRELIPGEKFARDCILRHSVLRFLSPGALSSEVLLLRPVARKSHPRRCPFLLYARRMAGIWAKFLCCTDEECRFKRLTTTHRIGLGLVIDPLQCTTPSPAETPSSTSYPAPRGRP
jgi:hypothetical protein